MSCTTMATTGCKALFLGHILQCKCFCCTRGMAVSVSNHSTTWPGMKTVYLGGWFVVHPYPLLREQVYTADLGRCLRRLTSRRVMLGAPVRALGALWPRLFGFMVFANGCRRPSRRSSVRARSLRGAVLCRRGALYPPAAGAAEGSPHTVHRLARL